MTVLKSFLSLHEAWLRDQESASKRTKLFNEMRFSLDRLLTFAESDWTPDAATIEKAKDVLERARAIEMAN